MKKVAFTIVDDLYYYPVGAHIFVNSFKRFHPDIDLVVFRQDVIDKIMPEKKINFYQAKPTFAKLLTDKYDLVVNIDSDTIILDRLSEIFDNNDYDYGAVWNYNTYENSALENITDEMYLQAGLVASKSKLFWDIWEEANKGAMQYLRKENDVLNLIAYNDSRLQDLKRVIFDQESNYLGCKSLGQEDKFYLEDGKVKLNGEIVKSYHWARGAAFPKFNWDRFLQWGTNPEVVGFMKTVAYYGQSTLIRGVDA